MSLHIGAQKDEIAKTVLITGDPLRAKYHAERMLHQPQCNNQIRGMLGYTGLYKGIPISIQGTGIGIPSTALYVHELIYEYGVTCIIRVGTCGAIQPGTQLGDIILASSALTDSHAIQRITKAQHYQPMPDLHLLKQAEREAERLGMVVTTGKVYSTDLFYSDDDPVRWAGPIKEGVIGVEMETAVLFALAAQNRVKSLSILTVSDHILSGETATAEDRETKTTNMIRLALEVAFHTCV